MHSNVTIKNISWPHFSWATLYMFTPTIRLMIDQSYELVGVLAVCSGYILLGVSVPNTMNE